MTSDLPPLIQDLQDLIGLPAALAIVEEWAGTEVYIPAVMAPDHVIAKRIGFEAAAKLAAKYGRDRLKLPRCVARIRAKRDAEIRMRYGNRETCRSLARHYSLTERHILRIVGRKSHRPGQTILRVVDSRQQWLFKTP